MSDTGELSGALSTVDKATAQNPPRANSATSQFPQPACVRWIPECSRTEQGIAFGLFLLSFFYLCIFRRSTWIDFDEGIILQGAQRILDGQVLYRDFFSFFTPGSYYLLALVFRVFGDSYLVAHTALAFIGAGFSPITYLLARRVCSRQASLLVTGLMTITALPLRFVVMHNWDSTLWACLALYCAVRLLESPSVQWAFAAASFVSLTILFEQSKGAGLLLGLGTGFLIVIFGSRQPKLFTRDRLIAIMLGLAWPFFVTVVYFASRHALTTMLASWFWPLQHYSVANRVPYGYDNMAWEARHKIFDTGSPGLRLFSILVFSALSWVPFLPIFGLALLIRLTFRRWRRISLGPEWAYYVLVSATISGLLLSIIIARSDYFHFVYLQPVFFLALAWLLDGRSIRNRFFTWLAPVLGFCLSMSLLALAAQLLFSTRAGNTVVTRRGAITALGPDTMIAYVQAHVAPGERILIYPYEPTYYYLTQTYSPTRFEYYQPGMHTDRQLQEMLAEFSAHPTRVVLYQPAFADHIPDAWPNTPPSAFARDAMADYIMREYRGCITLTSPNNWHFLFMMRRDLACPNGERPSS